MDINDISGLIIFHSIEIHKRLGPGLFESVYEEILYYELTKNAGLSVQRQQPIPLIYDELQIPEAFKADLIVEEKIIVELKSVKELANVHKKQLLTYLKLTGLQLGLLINFNESLLKNGIKRVVNGLE